MAKVELKNNWFMSTTKEPRMIDRGTVVQTTSGARYRKGVHEIPEKFLAMLPKSAKILDKVKPNTVVDEEGFRDHDLMRDKMAAVRAAKGR
jgi:hypothetical protein